MISLIFVVWPATVPCNAEKSVAETWSKLSEYALAWASIPVSALLIAAIALVLLAMLVSLVDMRDTAEFKSACFATPSNVVLIPSIAVVLLPTFVFNADNLLSISASLSLTTVVNAVILPSSSVLAEDNSPFVDNVGVIPST